jgi:hypothetical protein
LQSGSHEKRKNVEKRTRPGVYLEASPGAFLMEGLISAGRRTEVRSLPSQPRKGFCKGSLFFMYVVYVPNIFVNIAVIPGNFPE